MNIGIVSPHMAHERNYAMLQFADVARALGCDVAILSPLSNRPTYPISDWDREIQCRTQAYPFDTWACRQDLIIWSYVPSIAQVDFCRKHKIKTACLILWHEVGSEDGEILRAVDYLLSPLAAVGKKLRHWQFKNCYTIPWGVTEPIFQKPLQEVAAPKLLFPLWGGAVRRVDAAALRVVWRLLARTNCSLTVGYSASTLPSTAKKRLRVFKKEFPGRVTTITQTTWVERSCLYQQHDLTFWPTCHENIGLIGMQSVAAGTPVAAFAAPPVSEILPADNNVLVPPQGIDYTVLRIPVVRPDYPALYAAVADCVQNPTRLASLQHAQAGDATRRKQTFHNCVSQFLEQI